MSDITHYEAARRALAMAASVDEVREVIDKAAAVQVYARQAANRELEIQAAEIRVRAERRLGELLIELKADGKLDEGGRPRKTKSTTAEVLDRLTLATLGVSAKLSARAQRYAQIPADELEAEWSRWRERMSHRNERVTLDVLREFDLKRARKAREEQYNSGGTIDDLQALAQSGFRAGVILADPPWHFGTWSSLGEGRSATAHYATAALDEIAKLPVADLAAPDAMLFLWSVDWYLDGALDLIRRWGFDYRTVGFTWAKSGTYGNGWHVGQGYYTRANPETCLLGVRGKPRRLDANVRQLLVSPVREHSRKPDEVHDRIESLTCGPYLELFARRERPGWTTWGNELAFRRPEGHGGKANSVTVNGDTDGTESAVPEEAALPRAAAERDIEPWSPSSSATGV